MYRALADARVEADVGSPLTLHLRAASIMHHGVPERLAALDERLVSWMSLARRFRKAPNELHATLQGWRDELAALDAAADLNGLERACIDALSAYEQEARGALDLGGQAL